MKDDATETGLSEARALLLAARRQRIPPALDDKILADWNGLAIAALARAATAFGRSDWLAAARAAFAFVQHFMQIDDSGEIRLRHSWRAGEARHVATLDDYAQMSRAALLLHEATGDQEPIAQARRWVDILDRHYWDDIGGGYFFTADDTDDVISRTKNAHDNATPSGNGTMVEVLARLFYLTGEDRYRVRADALIAAFAGEVVKNAYPYATLLRSADLLARPVQLVVVGENDTAATQALLRTAAVADTPNLIRSLVAPDASLPTTHPAAGKGQIGESATAYVCVGAACSLPLTEPDALAAALARAA